MVIVNGKEYDEDHIKTVDMNKFSEINDKPLEYLYIISVDYTTYSHYHVKMEGLDVPVDTGIDILGGIE